MRKSIPPQWSRPGTGGVAANRHPCAPTAPRSGREIGRRLTPGFLLRAVHPRLMRPRAGSAGIQHRRTPPKMRLCCLVFSKPNQHTIGVRNILVRFFLACFAMLSSKYPILPLGNNIFIPLPPNSMLTRTLNIAPIDEVSTDSFNNEHVIKCPFS